MIAYYNGIYCDAETISISPEDRGFLFGDGVYEVIRAYNGHMFHLQDHINRLEYGLRELRFEMTDTDFLQGVCTTLLQQNKLMQDDALVYIQITRGVAPRSHAFPPKETPPTVYAKAYPFTPHSDEQRNGIQAITYPDQRWGRCDIKTVSLIANTMAHQAGREKHCPETLFVRDGYVTEGSHSNVFIVSAGRLITPPADNRILNGITRRVVLELAHNIGIPCKERPISRDEFMNANEAFIAGTTVEITPIHTVDGASIGSPHTPVGSVTRSLQKAFQKGTGVV